MKKNFYSYALVGIFLLLGSIATAQSPSISGLSLDASSPNYSTNDILTASYTANNTVETTAAWYADWVPISVLQMPFEAGLSNALQDYSGSGNDASLSGDAASEPVWGATVGHNSTGAFTFDGNDYLEVLGEFPTGSSYTKSAWVYATGLGYRNIISGTTNADLNHSLKVNPDGRLNAGHSFGDYYVVDSDSMFLDVWYHVAVTFEFSTGEMILYKNGVEVDRAIVPLSNRSIVDNDILIGAKWYDFFWTGNIDDARVYDRALSYEQIQYLYNDGGVNMASQETRGNERWRVRVTPFSASEVGSAPITNSELIQAAEISSLSLTASSTENLTDDDLTASFSSNASVVESAATWYIDGNPFALLHLPMDGGPAEALLDYSGNNNDASKVWNVTSDPYWDENGGINSGSSFYFDGDDWLEMGDIFPLNSSYTKTAWVWVTDLGYNHIISSVTHADNNHFLKINNDGRLNAGHSFGNADVADPTPLALYNWYFVAVTFDFDTGEMILYKDGAVVATGTVAPALRAVADPSVLIGSMNRFYNWEGNIDDARIYARALSPEQITELYNWSNVIVAEETLGGEQWHVEVTPFSYSEAGNTSVSNSIDVRSVIVSDITDQNTTEGTPFNTIDLDNYVTVYEFTEADLVWTPSGNAELLVSIDPVSHVATVTIPDVDWVGSENITFTATNPNGDSDFTEVTYTVTNVNDAPVLTEIGGQSTNEDVTLTGLSVDFTDPDPGDSHTLTVISSDPNVTVVGPSGNTSGSTYDLVPAPNWYGSSTITVTVADDGTGALEDSYSFTLVVNEQNDPPVLTDIGDQSTGEDTTLTGLSVVFTDVDAGDLHTISIDSDNANVTGQNLSGHISGSQYDLVPAANWNGSAQITVSVTDNGTGALVDSETYTFTVRPWNDAPVITEIADQTVAEDHVLSGLSVDFVDPDAGDTHTITVTSNEAAVSVTGPAGQTSGSTYDLVPDLNWFGTAQITVTVTDDATASLSDFQTYNFTVNPVDDAPTLVEIGDQVMDEDEVLRGIPLEYSDPESSDTHTVTVVPADDNVRVTNLGGSSYSLLPNANWNGSTAVTVTVTQNGSTLSDSEVYTLTVNPVNDAPESVQLSNSEVQERSALGTVVGLLSSVDVDLTDTDHTYTFATDGGQHDVDNDAFVIVGDTLKTNMEFDYEVKNSYSILVQSDDGNGGTFDQNLIITITDLDETSVEDIYNSPAFNVYPNPAVDFVTVEVDNPENRELLLEIYFATGAVVHSEMIWDEARVDLSGFKDGMYVVRISGEKVYGTRKLIVKDR